MAFIYDTPVDPDAENNCHAFILDIVGFNKRVLEVGCATGHFTKVLAARGCKVVGVELDPDAAAVAETWADRVVVGDLDAGSLWEELEGEQFDVITFGDVLEHLRDPLATLRSAMRHLHPSGFVVISVPNIAHGDVRVALLHGGFPYADTGLLDRTHIRFFTKSGLRDLIRESGLVLMETRRVVTPLFQTELPVERDGVDQSTIDAILEDPEAETYQFVVKATVDNGSQALAELAGRVNELSDRVHDEVVRTAIVHKEMQSLRDEREATRQLLEDSRRESATYKEELEAVLDTKTFRLVAPLRRLYGAVRQASRQASSNTQ